MEVAVDAGHQRRLRPTCASRSSACDQRRLVRGSGAATALSSASFSPVLSVRQRCRTPVRAAPSAPLDPARHVLGVGASAARTPSSSVSRASTTCIAASCRPMVAAKRLVVLDLVGACSSGLVTWRRSSTARSNWFERPGPAVALVADEALRDGERMTLALLVDAHHLAEQRRASWRSRARSGSGPFRLPDARRA